MMLTVVFVLGLFAVASADECCAPSQWTVIEGELVGSVVKGGTPSDMEVGVKVSVDGVNKKIAGDLQGVVNGQPIKAKGIKDYEKGLEYVIMNGKCNTTKIGEWVPPCIPAQAKFVTTGYLGSPKTGLHYKSYFMEIATMQVSFSVVRAEEGCIPLGSWMWGSSQGVSFVSSYGFSNFTMGVDPRAFDVPAICGSGKLVSLPPVGHIAGRPSLFDLL